jgi:hypothetical protein
MCVRARLGLGLGMGLYVLIVPFVYVIAVLIVSLLVDNHCCILFNTGDPPLDIALELLLYISSRCKAC